MKHKKALSGIVVILLLIMISIASLTALFLTVKKTINQPMLSPESCASLQLKMPIKIREACINSSAKEIKVKLLRTGENLNIDEMEFITSSENQTIEWCCGKECPACRILTNGEKTYPLILSEQDEIPFKITLKIQDCLIDTKNLAEC